MNLQEIAGQIIDKQSEEDNNIGICFIKNSKYFRKYSRVIEQKTEMNDIVIGEVFSVKEKSIVVNLAFNLTKKIEMRDFCVLPISYIDKSFINSLKDDSIFHVGDVIKARVSSIFKNDIVIKTNESALGVILTQCSFCYNIINKLESEKNCKNCGYVNKRKFSKEYNTEYN